ncbi:MAG TPA: LacI family DNA-binding transcriptional regulator [Solirubrobacteraceae bacterium]|nr:LacI family DNA-binding transcriptional regulator [Solirubrobacteraceae bacterium]
MSEAESDGAGRARARARLADVARDAGVSVATVSKVLNGRPDVATHTRARVERHLQAHGYLRRGGESRAERMLELVFHEITGEWAAEIIPAVERAARQAGFSLIVTEAGDRHSPGSAWIEEVLRRRPIGVILIFSDLDALEQHKLRSRGINVVVMDPAGEPGPEIASIGSTNWAGGLAAAEHLIGLGHRRIGMISGPEDMLCSVARVDGYRSALERAGIGYDPDLVRVGDFHVESGRVRAAELMALERPPTAIFAGSDLQAVGVYEYARVHGVRIPEDLSVMGYDDLQLSRWVGPPLTTIRQPLSEMAATAARQLIAMDTDPQAPLHRRIELATSLVVRESTAPPRGS